jgi:hypothetical protein
VTTALREEARHQAWPFVVRVALAASLVVAALGAALYRAGLSSTPIVIGTAVVGLTIGMSLPAARPSWMRRTPTP